MTKIEFTMSVDIDDPKAVKACAAFFAALAEGETSEKPAAKPRATKKPIAPEVVGDGGAEKIDQLAIEAALKIEKLKEAEKTKNTTGITIDQVRKMVQEKAKDHKTAMVAKLKEYGVPNVTKLGPAHYEEFMTFLKDLD